MAQGRGSAVTVVVALLLVCVLFNARVADSAVYNVGDSSGWSFNTDSWSTGKRFKAGDVLVFKYDATAHDVVAVSAAGYRACAKPASGARVYKSGADRVTLARGTNYFICSIAGHCQSGMKIAVTAA
ncbi:chemocyanin-like [Lolium perenne]|uniref:chemocyanin-like n=1 Tax=Lolium perenne TaxID=4522 RepID=UPI0021EB3A23|nr:chemocyanin-like [Lolium perenne]